MTRQALTAYLIGNSKDEVLWDVLPMGSCAILLVRPYSLIKVTFTMERPSPALLKSKDIVMLRSLCYLVKSNKY